MELGTLFDATKVVHLVTIDGLEINIPPKGERPRIDSGNDGNAAEDEDGSTQGILVEEVIVTTPA